MPRRARAESPSVSRLLSRARFIPTIPPSERTRRAVETPPSASSSAPSAQTRQSKTRSLFESDPSPARSTRALDAHRRPTDRRGNFFPTVPASALSPILASPAFVIRRAGLRPLALSVKSPRPARMTARVNRRRALEFAARRLVATHLTDLPPRSSARRTNPRASAAPTRRPAVAVAVALGDPTAREALARRRLTSRDRRKSPFNAVSRSTDRGRQTRGEAAREGLSPRSRLVRIRHVESHLAGRGGYGHPRVWVPEAAGRARARERERESAARAMGACASRCAREEMRGVGVVMSRGASSDAGGGRRADG